MFFGLDRYQHRFVRSDQDLIHLLPGGDATVFYAQVDLLRRAGMLNLLAGAKTSQDREYQAFVEATGFNYAKDVDAIAGSAAHDNLFLVVKGRFAWNRMRAYVEGHNGHCSGHTCRFPGSEPGTWISLVRVQSTVLGMARGKSKDLVSSIHPNQQPIPEPYPTEPVWVRLAPSLLKNPAQLPVALRIFAISMESADAVVVALAPVQPGSQDAFEIKLVAECPVPATADTIRTQLELETKTLKLELAHEHQEPNPADLTGLLTSGKFQTNGKEVTGEWPVSKQLVKTLQ